MSSMRPPILAGPMLRQTNLRNSGSSDQLTGVGVGLGDGLGLTDGVGVGVCPSAGAVFCA
jgi:hypothetical protein